MFGQCVYKCIYKYIYKTYITYTYRDCFSLLAKTKPDCQCLPHHSNVNHTIWPNQTCHLFITASIATVNTFTPPGHVRTRCLWRSSRISSTKMLKCFTSILNSIGNWTIHQYIAGSPLSGIQVGRDYFSQYEYLFILVDPLGWQYVRDNFEQCPLIILQCFWNSSVKFDTHTHKTNILGHIDNPWIWLWLSWNIVNSLKMICANACPRKNTNTDCYISLR